MFVLLTRSRTIADFIFSAGISLLGSFSKMPSSRSPRSSRTHRSLQFYVLSSSPFVTVYRFALHEILNSVDLIESTLRRSMYARSMSLIGREMKMHSMTRFGQIAFSSLALLRRFRDLPRFPYFSYSFSSSPTVQQWVYRPSPLPIESWNRPASLTTSPRPSMDPPSPQKDSPASN